MLNVKATPCEKSKALVLVGEGRLGFSFSKKFMDDLEEAKPVAFGLFFELVKGAVGFRLVSMYSYRRSNPKRWYRFLKFCKKDGRIKVYRENNKMVYEVPTYFEE